MRIKDQIEEVRAAIKNLDCDEQVSKVLNQIVDTLELLNNRKADKSVRLR